MTPVELDQIRFDIIRTIEAVKRLQAENEKLRETLKTIQDLANSEIEKGQKPVDTWAWQVEAEARAALGKERP